MTKRKRTLQERAEAECEKSFGAVWPGDVAFWLRAYHSGKREGKTEAMEDCGWGAGRRSRK